MTATVHVDTTCPYCGRTADARIAKVLQVSADPRRFAHETCWLRTFDRALEAQRKGGK